MIVKQIIYFMLSISHKNNYILQNKYIYKIKK